MLENPWRAYAESALYVTLWKKQCGKTVVKKDLVSQN